MHKTEGLVKWPTVYMRQFKYSFMPHGKHTFQRESDMAMARMCEYPSSKYTFPYWKCVLHCCVQCPRIDIPSPESDQKNSNIIQIINFIFTNT